MVVTENLDDLFGLTEKVQSYSLPVNKKNNLKLTYSLNHNNEPIFLQKAAPLPFAASEVYQAKVINWRRLTKECNDFKTVYEMTFGTEGSNFKFKPGDTIGILPRNEESEVTRIATHLNLCSRLDDSYTLTTDDVKAKIPLHIPVQSTLRHLLTYCLDIRCIVKKLFLLALANYTKDTIEKKALEYLSSKEGSTAYNNFILNRKLTLLDILEEFKSCKPPTEVLLAHVPRLLPRPYSIINSLLKDENILKICFSVLENGKKGLTTGYLESIILNESIENRLKNLSLNNSATVSMYLRKNINGFSLPEDNLEPIIMIGPGTGVGPFLGFLEERSVLKSKDIEVGESWLIFGCRDPKLDFLYEDELNLLLKSGVLNKLSTSFSRIENDGVKYVQDVIRKEGPEVARFLKEGARVYVCGDLNKMAAEVRNSIKQCLVEDQMTIDGAEQFVANLEKEKKYVVDLWN